MFTGPQRLTTRRPSPTTVSYTVSNARPRATIAARSLFYASILLRILAAYTTIEILRTKLRRDRKLQEPNPMCMFIEDNAPYGIGLPAAKLSWPVLALGCAAVLLLCLRRYHTGMPLADCRLPDA